MEVSDLIDDRHQDVRVTVGFGGLDIKLVVDRVEAAFRAFLIIEDLDDPLAVGELFDVTVRFGQSHLLVHEVTSALSREDFRDVHGRDGDENHDDGHEPVVDEHGDDDDHDGDDAAHNHRPAAGHGLAEGIDVVGVDAHDVAARPGVEIG